MASVPEFPLGSGAARADVAALRRCLRSPRRKEHRGVHTIELSDKLYGLLLKIVDDLADGKPVSGVGSSQEMTTQEAANCLGVSRQFLVRLLDQGKIPFHRVGTHRRLYLRDLISFRDDRDCRRHAAVEQIAREAVDDGVYDEF